ncbi:CRISPR-associated endonuclease Cas2 [Actinomyces ruminis]|uniref:CRISPR-associated endonuclease Cas2 n=1 Tax=Actinomyces ruminis TaxID=1937003 RepID=UPI00211EB227|nr:CRISPR-associated endonuclease Cas2 [Actinomyces ruminis]
MVIIAYDIASNRRRNKLATYLKGWGYRIQESVFQLRLSADDLDEVRQHILGIINDAKDVVHIYRYAPPVRSDPRSTGRPQRSTTSAYTAGCGENERGGRQ